MFGNLMNNRQVIKARESGDIDITPWDQGAMKSAHYPLTPKLLFQRRKGGETKFHDFERDKDSCVVPDGTYLIVEISQHIKLSEGIVGHFLPSSNLIELGYGLTAGRIEHPYGQKGEPVRFGLKNLLGRDNLLRVDDRLAYAMFYDLRGLNNIPIEYTEREWKLFALRLERASGGGVFYDDRD